VRQLDFASQLLRVDVQPIAIETQTSTMGDSMGATLIYNRADEGYGVARAVLPSGGEAPTDDGLIWHPLIPFGRFNHKNYGPLRFSRDHAMKMVDALRVGLPGPMGIPIDEDNQHRKRAEGAYGWIRDLSIQDDGLYAGVEWTEDGIAAIESRKLPYLSGHFILEHTDEMYGRDYMVVAAALCTQPFFFDQPALRVAATAYQRIADEDGERVADDQDDTELEDNSSEVTTTMPETAPEVIVDEVIVEIAETVVEAEAETVAEPEAAEPETVAEPEVTPETVAEAEPVAEPEPVADPAVRITALEARIADLEGQLATALAGLATAQSGQQLTEAEQRLAATAVGDGRRLAPTAIRLMATAEVHPTPENLQAVTAHILAHGGQLETMPIGDKPTLTLLATAGQVTDEEWLTAKAITEEAKAATRRIAAKKSIGLRAAYDQYLNDLRV